MLSCLDDCYGGKDVLYIWFLDFFYEREILPVIKLWDLSKQKGWEERTD
ncbi:hypothetical protein SAMN06265364_12146 [Prevotella jejuni]|jgi:hypothetical protein|uniref:Uncharacterized protein n=1 Tax=Prevotella jejuni TaxID=1177574 RepID=A0AA94LKT9_9BACT|nr:hypothetical protein SAMN06265364_12146 [Prevotella jejuni]